MCWFRKRLKTLTRLLIFVNLGVEKVTECKHYHTVAGPYNIELKRVERCPPEKAPEKDSGVYYSFKDARTRFAQPPTFHVNMSSPVDIDDILVIRISMSSWSNNGGWKENAFHINLKAVCSSLKIFFPDLRANLLKKIYGELIDCPLPAGIIRIHNISVSNFVKSPPGFDQFLYGRWRTDMQILNPKGEVVTCSRIFLNTVPK